MENSALRHTDLISTRRHHYRAEKKYTYFTFLSYTTMWVILLFLLFIYYCFSDVDECAANALYTIKSITCYRFQIEMLHYKLAIMICTHFSLQIQMNVQAAPTTATLMPLVLILSVPLHVHAIRDIAVMVSVRVQV